MNKTQLLASLKSQGFPATILRAFSKVPREKFIPENIREFAYFDEALPLEQGATISQPYTIAFMLNLLDIPKNKHQKILEIGSGCGYVLALLAEITQGKIYGIEIVKSLAKKSKQTLSELGYKKVEVVSRNGFQGLKKEALFDRILISAAASSLPEHLYAQLSNSGILVTPVLNSVFQIKKQNNKIQIKEFPGFAFVPLVNNNNN